MSRPPRRKGSHAEAEPVVITPDVLRARPLPRPDEDGDKDGRGKVLVVGGASTMPGAVVLAATAALRAGAGKLQIGTCRAITPHVGIAVPESLVIELPETRSGAIDPSAAEQLTETMRGADAALIGPGMVDEDAAQELLRRLLPRVEGTVLVLDAIALTCDPEVGQLLGSFGGEVVLTPHAGEMATMLGVEKAAVSADPLGHARRAAEALGAVIALKGRETYIVGPDGEAYSNRSGNVGLATSGSGDTLSGILAGLAARGASPLQAAAWGVYLHGSAGDRLARRMGHLGFLARELLAEIPPLMAELDGTSGE